MAGIDLANNEKQHRKLASPSTKHKNVYKHVGPAYTSFYGFFCRCSTTSTLTTFHLAIGSWPRSQILLSIKKIRNGKLTWCNIYTFLVVFTLYFLTQNFICTIHCSMHVL